MLTRLVSWEVLLPLTVVLFQCLQRKSFSHDLILTFPAMLAPLALIYPWAAIPGHMGVAFGRPRFFLHWLTKYPNLGPINYEVLLGILRILAASFVPAAFAIYRLAAGARRWVLIALPWPPLLPMCLYLCTCM